PRAGVTYEAVSQLKPVFRPDGTVTAGNCCPLNDGAAALVVMSDTTAKQLGITPLARIISTGDGAVAGNHGRGADLRDTAGTQTRGHDDRRYRSGRNQRGFRRAGPGIGASAGYPVGQAERQRRRDRGGSSVRDDGGSYHQHAVEFAATP